MKFKKVYVTMIVKITKDGSLRPLSKMILSFEECTSLPERELKCPYCSHYIEGVFADTTGHVRVKCNKCKAEMVLNVAYFRRLRKKLQRSRYQYADSYYQHRYK